MAGTMNLRRNQKMSKKAEERALEVYPVEICGYVTECRIGATPKPQDWNEDKRKCYQEGYEQAEKDLIERACRWMLGNLATYFGHTPVYQQDMINDFRKAMEEEL